MDDDVLLLAVFVALWVVLIAMTVFVLRTNPRATPAGVPSAFVMMGLTSVLGMASHGALWMVLTVAAMPLVGICLVRTLSRREERSR